MNLRSYLFFVFAMATCGAEVSADTLEERYPKASAAFNLVRESPLLERALTDPGYLDRISADAEFEKQLRRELAGAAFRRVVDTRSVRVELLQATTVESPAVVLTYQTGWDKFAQLPSGGPAQTDPVLLGDGRDSMWHRSFYGGTDDPAAHKAFERALDTWRHMRSNKRHEMHPRFVELAKEHLPTKPLAEVRAKVVGVIDRLVEAFRPYGAEVIDKPLYGHYGAKITDDLYLYVRDFAEDTPTRFEHDPFFWLIVSGGPEEIDPTRLPAFPGAEGMGALATGGRGGRVIYVTNTNSTGPGSLAEALQTPGPRIVLFKVSGQIDLPDQTWIEHGDLTLVGHTAPGEGVEVNGRLCVAAGNIVMRGMRWRLRPPTTKDGMSTRGRLHDVCFDHCSFAYASDELLRMIGGNSSFYGFTIQYCLLGPGLAGLGDHPYGPEVGGFGTFHHNIFNNTLSRSPEIDCALIDWRSNVMANLRSGHSLRPHSRVNLVNNYIIDIPGNPYRYSFDANDSVYMSGNLHEIGDEVSAFRSRRQSDYLTGPYPAPQVTDTEPQELEAMLMPIIGASLPSRDTTDAYFLEQMAARKSKLPHLKSGRDWDPYGNQNNNMALYDMWQDKDFPPPAAGAEALADADSDGMPDAWEQQHGLAPQDSADGPADSDGDGYTNVEEFLNRTDPQRAVDYRKPENNRHSLH